MNRRRQGGVVFTPDLNALFADVEFFAENNATLHDIVVLTNVAAPALRALYLRCARPMPRVLAEVDQA